MEKVKITFESEDSEKKVLVEMNPTEDGGLETVIIFEPEIDANATGQTATYAMVALDFMAYLRGVN